MKRKDGADKVAEKLFDMVRDEKPDQEVIDAIAAELRKAAKIAWDDVRLYAGDEL